MRWLRSLVSLLRGTTDQDAYADYRRRLLRWARQTHGLTLDEYRTRFENRYLDDTGRDLFLDYLLSVSKSSPSYLTEHTTMLADRAVLQDRFGLRVLTMRELRDLENDRLRRMESPLRM